MTQPGTLPQLPSPTFPKDQMLAALKAASGVQVVWGSSRRPAFNNQPTQEKARIIVRLVALSTVAIDEKRLSFNPVTNGNDSIVVAHRYFTLGLKAESMEHALEASDLLERVRIRLRTERIQTMLRPTIALRDCKNITPLPDVFEKAGNRVILTANMDVRYRCVLTFQNLDPEEANWIETDSDPWGAQAAGSLIP
jgi:hypothetical protein